MVSGQKGNLWVGGEVKKERKKERKEKRKKKEKKQTTLFCPNSTPGLHPGKNPDKKPLVVCQEVDGKLLKDLTPIKHLKVVEKALDKEQAYEVEKIVGHRGGG